MRNPESLIRFNDAVNAFYGSRLIIVDKVISGFLSTLVGTPELIELVSECAKTTNFRLEYNNAVMTDRTGKAVFRLPRNPRHVVALVVGLLFEFDKKSISIVDFVTRFYPHEASHDSYLEFLDSVITPFANAFRKLLTGDALDVVDEENDVPSSPNTLNAKAREDCDCWVRMLMDAVIAENDIADELRADAVTLIKGMMYALDSGNPIVVRLVWIGLRNTLSIARIGGRELKEIENILVNYGITER